jgi:pSer/pThr/pTyr-binding forkhead associated (FHA) protein
MPVKLRILAGPPGDEPSPRVERTIEVADHLAEIRLGRRAGLEIELPFAALSRLHARLYRDGTRWMVEDLGSALGTWLDGAALPAGGARVIAPGSTLRLAHISVVFDGVAASPAAAADRAPEGTATIARRLVSDLVGGGGGGEAPRLIGLAAPPWHRGPPPTLRLGVPDRSYLVGRDETCDLVLPSDEISREHAVIVRRWEGVHIRDLDSKNGVCVAGQPLAGNERHLRDGDQLTIGSIAFVFDDPEDRYLRQLEAAPDRPPETTTSSDATGTAGKAAVGDRSPLGWRTLDLPVLTAALVLAAIAAVALLLILG